MAVAAALGVPLVMQRLIEVNSKQARELDGDDKKLVADCRVWPGAEIIVELMAPGQDTSHALAHFQQSRNAATLV